MDPTATCEVTVVDENNAPIAGADVQFWPNQYCFDSGSNLVGAGSNSLDTVREKLKMGKPTGQPPASQIRQYGSTTDADGKAVIANLPAGPSIEDAAPRQEWFHVNREGYTPIANSPNPQVGLIDKEPNLVASLTPGKQSRVTIMMKKKPASK